jgi:alkaline phosphatase isozyme conversion protein
MKRILPLFLLFAIALSGCGNLANPANPVKPAGQTPTSGVATLEPLGTPAPKYGDVARALIRDFSNIGPRAAGSSGETQAAQYIAQVFQAIGYTPENQPFTAEANGQSINSANVVALKKGTSAQEIIVGAHYDSTDAGPGADDNASGVAVMLEVARLLSSQNTPYTIRFIAFGASENGLLGSYAYLNQMSQEEFENMIAMIDLDGLVAGDIAYVFSDEGQQSLVRNWALEWASGNGLDLQTVRDVDLTDPKTGKGSSDYAAFRDIGVPYAYFHTTNWTLGNKKGQTQVDTRFGDNGVIRNTKYDTLDYLDTTFPGRVDGRLDLFVTVLDNLLTQFEVPIQ